jgi:hypothetical protein
MSKRKLILCSSSVKKDAVKRETINGVEHIIVSSYTLPNDVVMNGGLYPGEEIEKSYKTLERTLAPVEHPKDEDGNFISASDPHAIHNYHAGAFNVNVTREDNRVHIEKHINVQEALKSERGKRLLDRIEELETNDDPRPIHTSTGVWLEIESTDGIQTNAEGEKYDWIARNMVFDHDAILLDNVGAAQPHQGVGMAVNAEGDKVEIEHVEMADPAPSATPSVNAVYEQLTKQLNEVIGAEWINIVDLQGSQCIFETNQGYYTVPFRLDGDQARIVGIPISVDKTVTYTPKVNSKEGDAMKELLLNALADAGVKTEGLTDDQLLSEYNKLQANQSKGDDAGAKGDDLAEIVANAVKPLSDEVASLKTQLNANAENEKQQYVDVIVNSGKYTGLDADSAKMLPVEKLKEMAGNCGQSYGLPLVNHGDADANAALRAPTEMPK